MGEYPNSVHEYPPRVLVNAHLLRKTTLASRIDLATGERVRGEKENILPNVRIYPLAVAQSLESREWEVWTQRFGVPMHIGSGPDLVRLLEFYTTE